MRALLSVMRALRSVMRALLSVMRALKSRVPGGYWVLALVAVVFVADVLISKNWWASITAFIGTKHLHPKDHFADLFAASGVAVAFVLTYLATLVALPSPARELLSSVLMQMADVAQNFEAIDPEARISPEEFVRLQELLDRAVDNDRNNPEVLDSYETLMKVVALAKLPQMNVSDARELLTKLGYSHYRANFLASVVFQKNTEKCHLLRATILAAIVFGYASVVDILYILGCVENSIVLPLGYLILGIMGVMFAVAFALRIWPHGVQYAVIKPIVESLIKSNQTKENHAVRVDLESTVLRAADARGGGLPTP
jgi:hypothetical protein